MASNIYLVRQRISRLGQRMSSFQLNLGPLKEPLGFIKVLEWFASIFAFATCGGYKGETRINVTCPPKLNDSKTITAAFGYPFRLNQVSFQAPDEIHVCASWTENVLVGDYASSAQFYVTFAVFVFLYCITALLLYIGYTSLYRDSRKLPMIIVWGPYLVILSAFSCSVFKTDPWWFSGRPGSATWKDFVITLVATFLWLVSTSAWAKALTDIKLATGHNIVNELTFCQTGKMKCQFDSVTSMGSLNVSVIFGFLNMILWGGNAWFVYKETNLHRPSDNTASHGQGGGIPPAGM